MRHLVVIGHVLQVHRSVEVDDLGAKQGVQVLPDELEARLLEGAGGPLRVIRCGAGGAERLIYGSSRAGLVAGAGQGDRVGACASLQGGSACPHSRAGAFGESRSEHAHGGIMTCLMPAGLRRLVHVNRQ